VPKNSPARDGGAEGEEHGDGDRRLDTGDPEALPTMPATTPATLPIIDTSTASEIARGV
jgi:hypothetical protein